MFWGVLEEKPIASPLAGPNQRKAEETWAETTAKLATLINQTCEEVSLDKATYMIERAHRSAPNLRYKGTEPRPFFAAFDYWPNTVNTIDSFRAKSIKDKAFKISADYKYGQLTTKRRNMAMIERKELKQSGAIVSGYVAYPARLMVKHSRDSKYVCHRDFSRERVILGKRD